MINTIIKALCSGISAAFAEIPRNSNLWTYTINSITNEPYITRTLFPRVAGVRPILHHIHQPDTGKWPHNHPWKWVHSLILSGGYTEERDGAKRCFYPGDINSFSAETFHHISHVTDDTWTLMFVGPRVQEWGFMVNGQFITHKDYFRLNGYTNDSVQS